MSPLFSEKTVQKVCALRPPELTAFCIYQHEHVDNAGMHRVTWIIIWLIVVAVSLLPFSRGRLPVTNARV